MSDARLGLQIDSGSAKRAAVDLDALAAAAPRAEAAVIKLGQSSTAALGVTSAATIDFSRRITEGMSGVGRAHLEALRANERLIAGMSAGAATIGSFSSAARLSGNQIAELGHIMRSTAGTMLAGGSAFQALGFEANRLASVLTIGPGGVGGTLKALGALITPVLLSPLGLVVTAFAGFGIAAVTAFSIERSHAQRAEEALKKHIDLIGRIKEAYKDAGDASSRFGAESIAVLRALDAEQRRIIKEQLNRQAMSVVAQQQGGMPGEFFDLPEGVRSALEELDKEARDGQADWIKYGDSLVKALSDPRIDDRQRKIIQGLLETAAAQSRIQQGLRPPGFALPGPMTPQLPTRQDSLIEILKQRAEVERIRRGMDADLTAISAKSPGEVGANAALRERISLTGEAVGAEVREASIARAGALARAQAEFAISEAQRQRLQTARDNLGAAQLEFDTVGKGIAQTELLRTNWQTYADLRREAEDNNVAFDQAQFDRLKKINAEIAHQIELTARAQLRSDLSFDRSQLFRSRTEQDVASQMRDIYGDDFISHMHDFEAEQIRINDRLQELDDIGRGVTKGFLSDLRSDLASGARFWDAFGDAGRKALDKIDQKLIDMASDQIWDSLFGLLKGSLGGGLSPAAGSLSGPGLFASGNAFDRGNVIPFRRGGVVDRPTIFPMARGYGLMGEAGPEAIMPLRRGSDGRLGVAANSNRPTLNVQINNTYASGAAVDVQETDDGVTINIAQQAAQERRARRAMQPHIRKSR